MCYYNTMTLIYESENFEVAAPEKPFVARSDGGHIQIAAKAGVGGDRTKLHPKQAVEFMRLSMLAGGAFQIAMNSRGVPVERVEYESSMNIGQWLHMHILGKTKQSAAQTVCFPAGEPMFHNNLEPLNEMDIKEIQDQIRVLEQTEKYKEENWELKNN